MQQFLEMDKQIADEYGGTEHAGAAARHHPPIHMPFHQRSNDAPSAASLPVITATPVKRAPAATSRRPR